jgi:hypothetical protein
MNKKWFYAILTVTFVISYAMLFAVYSTSRSQRPMLMKEYKVRQGDTCKAIALEYHTTIESIVQLNQLTPACEIWVDQRIYLAVPAP